MEIGPCAPLWTSFLREVSERQLSVLEVGARQSVFGMPCMRDQFDAATDYVGLDVHPGVGVDLVGDVHQLSSLLHGRRFGAIHSASVLEHIAMPWVAALEMVKALEVGGIMFHHVPFAWPMHEMPWDFWRFTSETFRVLYPPIFGVTIEAIGADHPLNMHMQNPPPEQERFHENVAFAYFGALIRKTAEVDLSRFQWPVTLDELLGTESSYPAPATGG